VIAAGVVDIREVAHTIPRPWAPIDLVRANDTIVRLAKLDGDFPWHHHEEDEIFLCWEGSFRIELADRAPVELSAGQIFVVPRRVRHRPVAENPALAVLIERPETLQYGNTPP
jgi:mannose-6-phosphate isomerase-like protein (cupin superfamily)